LTRSNLRDGKTGDRICNPVGYILMKTNTAVLFKYYIFIQYNISKVLHKITRRLLVRGHEVKDNVPPRRRYRRRPTPPSPPPARGVPTPTMVARTSDRPSRAHVAGGTRMLSNDRDMLPLQTGRCVRWTLRHELNHP